MVHQLSKILKHFHTRGWRLVASADISAKFKKHGTKYVANDVHSWFFLHEPESVIMSDSIIKIEEEDLVSELNYHQPLRELQSEKSFMAKYYLCIFCVIIMLPIILTPVILFPLIHFNKEI